MGSQVVCLVYKFDKHIARCNNFQIKILNLFEFPQVLNYLLNKHQKRNCKWRISRTKRFSGIERGDELSKLTNYIRRTEMYTKDGNSARTDKKVTNWSNWRIKRWRIRLILLYFILCIRFSKISLFAMVLDAWNYPNLVWHELFLYTSMGVGRGARTWKFQQKRLFS